MKNILLNHIQFLRGLSVLLVFFYHLKLNIFQYGFLGVDIFFVISGYVITSRIYKEYQNKRSFNFIKFYLKRIKRIYPVLIFILSSTFVFIIFFQPLDLFLNNLLVYFFSIIGLSNFFYLFSKKDYFDTVFDDPLAHTWSLGVEEQFYLIFPIFFILVFINFKKLNNIFYFLSFLIITGIIVTFIFQSNTKLTFYSPIFRFWEFLIGTLTFLISTRLKFKSNLISPLTLLGLLFLILLVKELNATTLILISTISSAIFILLFENNKKGIFNLIIENKFFVYFGNISYSFYLWHLPIIYFYDLYFVESFFRIPSILLITICLSIFSYIYIENKFRYIKFRNSFNYKKILPILFSLFFIFSFINFIAFKDSYDNKLKQKIKSIIYNFNYLEREKNFTDRTVFYNIKIGDNQIYRFCTQSTKSPQLNNKNLRIKCLKNDKNKNRIFYIEGNSHTANFIPLFNSLNIKDSIYFNHVADPLININFELINNLTESYDQVIYSTNINTVQSLKRIELIKKKFNEKVKILILGPVPNLEKNINPLKCFIKNIECKYKKLNDFNSRNLEVLYEKLNQIIKRNKNILFFNSYDSICSNDICIVFDKNKNLLTHRDKSHLTIEGSILMKNAFNDFYKKKIN